MAWKRLLGIGLMATLLMSGCANFIGVEEEPTPTPVPTPATPSKPTYQVRRGVIKEEIAAIGRVASTQEETLFFKASGRVKTVTSAEEVKKGDLLAELEVGDLDVQLVQAKINLEVARLRLAKAESSAQQQREAEADSRPRDIAAAELALERAQAELERLKAGPDAVKVAKSKVAVFNAEQAVAKAQEELAKLEAKAGEEQSGNLSQVSDTDLEMARLNLQLAQATLEAAQAELAQVEAGPTKTDIKAAELNVQVAQARLDALKKERPAATDYDLEILLKSVELAQLNYDQIVAQREATRIVAPFDARVTWLRVRSGDSVNAYAAVITIADPDSIQVSADIVSTDWPKLEVGQKATLLFTDFPDEEYTGTVARLPTFGRAGDGKDITTKINLDTIRPGLKLGALARVTILLQEKENVLLVPRTAIRSTGDRRYVFLWEDGRKRQVDVKLGITNGEETEILEGLEEGQTIIVD